MKNSQKGFVPVVIIVVIGAILIGGGALIYQQTKKPLVNNNSGINNDSQKIAEDSQKLPIQESPNDEESNPNSQTVDSQSITDNPIAENQTEETPPTAKFEQYPPAESSLETVNAANQFAFELYGQYKNTSDNIFFSPYSISSALGMTYEGAKGKTAQEMQSVFHLSADPQTRLSSFAKLYRQINPQKTSYQLSVANALWAQKSFPFNPDYLKTVETYYGGKAANLDFIKDAEGSRQTINNWVSQKTNNKISELFAKNTINELTRLVLTNAVYFKGKWAKQFEESGTQQKEFTTASGSKTQCSMMAKIDSFKYAETADYQTIELPYENNDLSMIVILPQTGKTNSFENDLSIDKFSQIKNSLQFQRVNVYLPKLKFSTSYPMNDTLKAMGMSSAFNQSSADFSGMTGKKDLFIDLVIHKAYIDVNEEGTEATAATGVAMKTMSIASPSQPKIFNADHPFIFAIIHNQSNSILFLGKVNKPK